MALTEAQKIIVRTVLDVKKETDTLTHNASLYQLLEDVLVALNADQITRVETLLSKWAEVEFSTGKLKGEFEDDPAKRRSLIKNHMKTAIGFDPDIYKGRGNQLGRG